MANSSNRRSESSLSGLQLRKLTLEQVEQIDQFLEAVGDYGEVHVIVQRGEVRYINKVESHKVRNNGEADSG